MNTPVRRLKAGLILSCLRAVPFAGLPLLALLAGSAHAQTTYYWDGNGATTGSGATTLAGNWGGGSASAFWGTSATGTSATTNGATITSADTVVFAANDGSGTANNYNSTYTVTLGAAQSVAGLAFNGASVGSGNTGGTVTLAGTGSPGLTIGSGGVTLNGSNGDPTFAATIGTITLGADQTWTVNNAHVWTVAAAVAGNATTGNTRTWTFGYLNAFTSAYSGVISNGSGGGELAITLNNTNGSVTGGGTNNISGTANTYTGKTTITRGILQISSLKNVGGGSSSLGAPTTIANGTIDIGSGANSGSLYYNGSAASTSDRVINLAGSTGGATISSINATAANTLTLTSNLTAATGNKTLTLQGANTGANTISGIISDPDVSTKISLVKSEAGRWVLGGANTYSGGTTINAGTLSVGAAGTLGQNVVGNNVTIAGGNLLFSADTNVGSNQTITITSAGGGIGVSYTPSAFPSVTDNSGTTGGVFGLNYTGTGGIGSISAIDGLFTSSSRWFLGSFVGGSGTYTGTSLTAGNGSTYRLGGGGGVLTMQNNVLTGANNLLVGSTGGGTVTMSSANTYTGKTTLQNGTLNISSVNKVSGGGASSSLGAPTTVGNGTIDIGSGSNAVTLNYTGTGETSDRVLNFAGTTGAVTLTNSGTGNLSFTGTSTFTGSGAKAFTLGTSTDTFGGSFGPILDNGGVTTVTKNGLTNSTWTLNGTNTYTGTTTINGGVISASDLLASSARITLSGSGSTTLGVLQGQGTITRQLGTGASRVDWSANSGFSAKGGKLTLTLTNNAGTAGGLLTWGAGSFMGTGITPMVFGSSTSDNQVELTNNFTFGDNVSSGFNRTIYVDKGTGGDSALLSGVISVGGGTSALNGFNKTGNGTLILSGTNTYTGTTGVAAGTLIAQGNVPSGSAGAFGNASSAITMGLGNISGTDGTAATNASPTVLIGGAFSFDRAISIANIVTTGTYAIGGSTDNNASFTGLITPSQSVSITQVATTAGHVLTVSGNITGGATAAVKTVTFDNVGDVLQTTGVISNGAGGGSIAVTKTNSGTATLAGTNTYTGVTTLTGGVLSIGTVTNGGVAGPIGAATNAAANLVFNGGTLQYTGATASTDRNFTLNAGTTGTINVSSGAANLTLSGASTATTGGLTKTGAGTLTLGGANLYTGTTTISAGTLALGSSGLIASSAIINLGTSGSQGILDVSSKASFVFGAGQTLKGYGTVNIGAGKTVTINGNLAPGNSPGITNVTGDLVLANAVAVPTTGAITTMELGGNGGVAGTDYDKVVVSGQITFGGTMNIIGYLSYNINQAATYHLFGFGSQTGSFDFVSVAGTSLANSSGVWTGSASSFDYTFTQSTGDLVIVATAIPEPATYAALAGGLALLGTWLTRRRKTLGAQSA